MTAPGIDPPGNRCTGRAAVSGGPGPGPCRWVSDGGCHGGPMVCQPPAVLGAVEFAGVQQAIGEPVPVERRRDRVTCRAAGAPPRCSQAATGQRDVPGSAGGHPADRRVREESRDVVVKAPVTPSPMRTPPCGSSPMRCRTGPLSEYGATVVFRSWFCDYLAPAPQRYAYGQRSAPPTRHASGPITIGPSAPFYLSCGG